MSDTPRMKAAQMASIEHMTGDVYRVGCDLERELNAANTIIRQQQLLEEENLRLKDRIKRLDEAGDYLNKCLLSVMGENHPAKQAWRKAKEVKP